ncbi:2-keto-4-pentenoate hydratase [Neobacillus drentensis]|jgi:2-oxo-3-hexenedioate decarboxylase|uniref:2-keto-4-pentenoate hydratase n=1 Tax=Neobacillus drentensis TaxID=220684 RepID=UPI002FFF5B3E
MIATESIEQMANELFLAEKSGMELDQLVNRYPHLDVELAYEVQQRLVDRKCIEEKTRVAGWKLGLTSKAKQEMMGVHEPTYGVLLQNMQLYSGEPISLAPFIHAKIEPEMAFIMNRELRGPGVTVADILAATEYVAPALEIIDSRYRNFSFSLLDVIADNSSSSRFIIGDKFTRLGDFDLSLVGMVFKQNGKIVATSAGASVMGHPARAVAWMVNKLALTGQYVKPGEVILSGALTGAVAMKENDVFSCHFDHLGSLDVSFTE